MKKKEKRKYDWHCKYCGFKWYFEIIEKTKKCPRCNKPDVIFND